MTHLLVDPWVLENLIRDPVALRAFSACVDIARDVGLDIAEFVDGAAEAAIWSQQAEAGPLVGLPAATVARYLEYFLVEARAEPEAFVEHEPPGIPRLWHQALRACIGDGREWRDPRIICPAARRGVWPSGHEVIVRCSDCSIADPLRVISTIEDYAAHPFFGPDMDPWDLRRHHPLPRTGRNLPEHECWLPRPPALEGVPLHEVDDALSELRDSAWRTETHCYYLPPREWRVGTEPKLSWRSGRAFPTGQIGGHSGWRDRNGIIWEWHKNDREWDVQYQPHLDVAPDGMLKK